MTRVRVLLHRRGALGPLRLGSRRSGHLKEERCPFQSDNRTLLWLAATVGLSEAGPLQADLKLPLHHLVDHDRGRHRPSLWILLRWRFWGSRRLRDHLRGLRILCQHIGRRRADLRMGRLGDSSRDRDSTSQRRRRRDLQILSSRENLSVLDGAFGQAAHQSLCPAYHPVLQFGAEAMAF